MLSSMVQRGCAKKYVTVEFDNKEMKIRIEVG
jgi:hypothetical protein